MPLRLRPLPSPARLKRKPEGDWLVAMHRPAPPCPGLQAYRLSCLPASPSRRPAFPKGFFRALPSPESSFPLSCGGGGPHSQDSLSSPPTPLFSSLLPCSPAEPQTAEECHLSPQRSGRCEDLGAHALPQAPSAGEDRTHVPAKMRLLPPGPAATLAEKRLYLHEAHAPHDLDALICHLPGCLLRTETPEIAFGAKLPNVALPPHRPGTLLSQRFC